MELNNLNQISLSSSNFCTFFPPLNFVIYKNWKKNFPKKEKKNYSNLIFKKKLIFKIFPNKFLVEKK